MTLDTVASCVGHGDPTLPRDGLDTKSVGCGLRRALVSLACCTMMTVGCYSWNPDETPAPTIRVRSTGAGGVSSRGRAGEIRGASDAGIVAGSAGAFAGIVAGPGRAFAASGALNETSWAGSAGAFAGIVAGSAGAFAASGALNETSWASEGIQAAAGGMAVSTPSTTAAARPHRVGIVCSKGTAADKITAVFRAVDSMGFIVKGITADFIRGPNFDPADFDVMILPAGTDEDRTEYELTSYSDGVTIGMGDPSVTSKLHAFVANGGGIIGLERGAQYILDRLNVTTGGSYTATASRSLENLTYADASFGIGAQAAFKTAGGGYLSSGIGQTPVAKDSNNRTVVACNTHELGRIVLSAYDLELRGDSLADWTEWDNWLVGGSHTNSVGSWLLLGKLINWAATGTVGSVTVNTPEPSGTKVAIVSSWYYRSSVPGYEDYGGASPTLLPAVARAVEYSGYVPVAIRWDDINAVPTKLDISTFKVVVFPGGFSYGYKANLGVSRTSGGAKNVTDFIGAGGGALGICAGSYYLSSICHWIANDYTYLGVFSGTDSGPILMPDYNQPGQYVDVLQGRMTLASVHIDDPTLYPSGNGFDMYQLYFGGGYKTGGAFTASVTYNTGYDIYDSGAPSVAGYNNAIRFTYGSHPGRVYLIGTHPEVRSDSSLSDWLLWSSYDGNGSRLSNPDNPWTFVARVFDNWLALP